MASTQDLESKVITQDMTIKIEQLEEGDEDVGVMDGDDRDVELKPTVESEKGSESNDDEKVTSNQSHHQIVYSIAGTDGHGDMIVTLARSEDNPDDDPTREVRHKDKELLDDKMFVTRGQQTEDSSHDSESASGDQSEESTSGDQFDEPDVDTRPRKSAKYDISVFQHKCNNCGKAYPSQQKLDHHKCSFCKRCGKLYASHQRFLMHTCRPYLAPNPGFKCQLCHRNFFSQNKLLQHSCAFCRHCKKIFASYQCYKRHHCICKVMPVIKQNALSDVLESNQNTDILEINSEAFMESQQRQLFDLLKQNSGESQKEEAEKHLKKFQTERHSVASLRHPEKFQREHHSVASLRKLHDEKAKLRHTHTANGKFKRLCPNPLHTDFGGNEKFLAMSRVPKAAKKVLYFLVKRPDKRRKFCQGCVDKSLNLTEMERRKFGVPPERTELNVDHINGGIGQVDVKEEPQDSDISQRGLMTTEIEVKQETEVDCIQGENVPYKDPEKKYLYMDHSGNLFQEKIMVVRSGSPKSALNSEHEKGGSQHACKSNDESDSPESVSVNLFDRSCPIKKEPLAINHSEDLEENVSNFSAQAESSSDHKFCPEPGYSAKIHGSLNYSENHENSFTYSSNLSHSSTSSIPKLSAQPNRTAEPSVLQRNNKHLASLLNKKPVSSVSDIFQTCSPKSVDKEQKPYNQKDRNSSHLLKSLIQETTMPSPYPEPLDTETSSLLSVSDQIKMEIEKENDSVHSRSDSLSSRKSSHENSQGVRDSRKLEGAVARLLQGDKETTQMNMPRNEQEMFDTEKILISNSQESEAHNSRNIPEKSIFISPEKSERQHAFESGAEADLLLGNYNQFNISNTANNHISKYIQFVSEKQKMTQLKSLLERGKKREFTDMKNNIVNNDKDVMNVAKHSTLKSFISDPVSLQDEKELAVIIQHPNSTEVIDLTESEETEEIDYKTRNQNLKKFVSEYLSSTKEKHQTPANQNLKQMLSTNQMLPKIQTSTKNQSLTKLLSSSPMVQPPVNLLSTSLMVQPPVKLLSSSPMAHSQVKLDLKETVTSVDNPNALINNTESLTLSINTASEKIRQEIDLTDVENPILMKCEDKMVFTLCTVDNDSLRVASDKADVIQDGILQTIQTQSQADNTGNIFHKDLDDDTGKFPIYSCKLCGKKFQHAGTLKVHERAHSYELQEHKCSICGKVCTAGSYLAIHMRTHKKETRHHRPHRCKHCDAMFSDRDNLKMHMRLHMGEKLYQCNVCLKSFTRKSQMEIHHRIHTGEKPYECKVCGRQFRQSNGLTLHLTTHTDQKPFRCELCGKGIGRKAHYVKHMRKHQGLKPFKCVDCGKAFTDKGNLATHRRIHAEKREFQCELCNKGFNQSYYYKNHMKFHSGEAGLSCEKCENVFETRSDLKFHVKTMHPGEYEYLTKLKIKVNQTPKGTSSKESVSKHEGDLDAVEIFIKEEPVSEDSSCDKSEAED